MTIKEFGYGNTVKLLFFVLIINSFMTVILDTIDHYIASNVHQKLQSVKKIKLNEIVFTEDIYHHKFIK